MLPSINKINNTAIVLVLTVAQGKLTRFIMQAYLIPHDRFCSGLFARIASISSTFQINSSNGYSTSSNGYVTTSKDLLLSVMDVLLSVIDVLLPVMDMLLPEI